MRDKRGVYESEVIVILVILAIVFFILFVFTDSASGNTRLAATKAACQASVMAKSASLAATAGSGETFDFHCDTIHLTVKSDGMYESTDTIKQTRISKFAKEKPTDELTEAIGKEILNQMATCWENMGEGRDVLGDFEGSKRCVPCSTIEFSDDKIKNLKIDDFYGFMQKTQMPKSDLTYYDYLMANSVKGDYKAQSATFTFDKPYTVVYVAHKLSDWQKLGLAVPAGVAAIVGVVFALPEGIGLTVLGVATTGGITGGAVWAMVKNIGVIRAVSIVPTEEIGELECEMLY